MARIIRAPAAERDALGIWTYVSADDAQAANRLLDRFDRMFRMVAMQPHLGKSVEELAPNLRFIPPGSYLIFYRPLQDGVETVRLLHGARDIATELFRQ